MSSRILVVMTLILILMLVYGGLRLTEEGIKDLIISGQSGQVLSWQRDASGEINIIFAGKTVVINIPEIVVQFSKMWDRLTIIRKLLKDR